MFLHHLLFLWLSFSTVYCNFDKTVRSHLDYESTLLNMEIGWGATRCLDFQEVSTIYRPITFQPALVVTCELKSHQCVTIRATNTTHYYTFQGCLPQARVSRMCTEMAYEAAKKNGEEYFFCYDVSYDRLNAPRNVPLFGRECCCNGDLCNRIENVKTIDTLIPHDQIMNPLLRTLHLWYWNIIRFVGILSGAATIFFGLNIFYIVLKPAERDDDKGWYSAPVKQNQLMDDIPDEEDEEGEEHADDEQKKAEEAAKAKEKEEKNVGVSKKKKKQKKGRATKEDNIQALVEKTQEIEVEEELPVAKTGDDKEDEKKDEKKEGTEKDKKEETPIESKEKKTQEAEPKKEEEEGTQFKLCKAKKLANGRIQYVSMFNENSVYSEDDD